MGQFDGKVAIVTGGAQGIGNAIAAGLAAEGARIVMADLAGAEEAADAFPEGRGLTVDAASEPDVERMVDETVGRCGGVDVLGNNAGLYASLAMRPFDQIPLEEWRRVMDVNVASMFLCCRAVVPGMRAGRRRLDHQHLLGDAVSRRAVPAPLRDQQGCDRRVHPRAGEGVRP